MENTITINAETYKAIKKEYDKAVADKKDRFTFEGHILLTSYAKYLLEYIRGRLGIK